MSETALIEKLDAIQAGSDFTDPQTYRDLLYGPESEGQAAATHETQGETTAPATTPAPEESSASPAAAEPTTEEPAAAGVATRDGKHVIPYHVLENARAKQREAEAKAADLQAKLDRMEGAGATSAEQTQAIEAIFSDEELADLANDFPAMKKLHDAYTSLAAKVATDGKAESTGQPTSQAAQDEQQDLIAAQTYADIKPNVLLEAWRVRGGGLWEEAKAVDRDLLTDPAWAAKSQAERFTEVQRRVADANGIPLPPPTAKNQPANAPAPRPAAPAREVHPTLTDFNGGPMATGDPMAGMQAGQMVDTAMGMSMEEIRRMVGLSY